jgi:hypothetical protein
VSSFDTHVRRPASNVVSLTDFAVLVVDLGGRERFDEMSL